MRLSSHVALGLFAFLTTVNAATVVFNQDPFAGTNAGDPGRQIVKGPGRPVTFDIATDVLFLNPDVFGISQLSVGNDLVENLPATGLNFVVVQNTGAPFGAGTAADLIAAQFTDPGPGFFIYFNTNLQLARLVFSEDLSDANADLSILARFTNLAGAAGFAALPTITAGNLSTTVPEPSTVLMTAAGALLLCCSRVRRRYTRQ
jgi:hypothetical protein